ncbi:MULTISPECIES: SCO1431 family membrane protein [Streptomyces]|uniref:SCO1431 family membrane protein n=2 Tax=Streptomyces sudanensis TaxID=436397 RepID=A0ABY4TGN0_9ACTN|nr:MULTISPECIES: SCO1431 family membrane protein [Streptomyces]MCP9959745.1 SCO1431 family membrane protein [Streptomyces sudanensis]MCP9988794.1 SCO1431 family membrane protein [Streptomyces sudanensis]MCP9999838.1 SCO1431 family membrane protein [Streptomyces sudanensis]URN18075.1 SCO1431 family membrane protein [Streptomyces sudanensis]
MTANAAAAPFLRARTGGPRDDGPELLEQLLGWVLVVVVAVFVTRAGLF